LEFLEEEIGKEIRIKIRIEIRGVESFPTKIFIVSFRFHPSTPFGRVILKFSK
jgi:hypothetical protein